jgi:hypothetical protein
MKKIIFALLAILLGLLAIFGGLAIGLSAIAYSIWIVVLMVKGTIAVSFWGIFKIVLCWIIGPLVGWLWGMFFGFLAGLCGTISGDAGRNRFVNRLIFPQHRRW